MNLTVKQKQILAVIFAKNKDGSLVDLDQIVERVPYMTTKDQMHFSIRALVEKGLVEKAGKENRRDRMRRLIAITPLGEHWARLVCPKPVPFRTGEIITEKDFSMMEEAVFATSIPEL